MTPKPSLCRRFSLRTFLTVIAIVCVALGLKAHRVRVQQNAIQKIKAAGGYVLFRSQCNADGVLVPSKAPVWNLASRRHDLWFDSVVAVVMPYISEDQRLNGKTNGASDVVIDIANLPHIRRLRLTDSDVSNEELSTLRRLRGLRILELSFTKIREGQMEGIRHLPLKRLSINSTGLDDDGLKSLRGMKTLESLYVANTKVSDDGLKHIETLTSLKRLGLQQTFVTQEGFEAIQRKMPKCSISWEPLARRPSQLVPRDPPVGG